MNETGCQPTTSNVKLRFDSVDFSDIPGQSKLFRQYQTDPLSLRHFYPSVVSSHTDIASRKNEVLENYVCDRDVLCDVLIDQNTRFGAGHRTFEQIQLLRSKDTVAVLTGQQAGLFTGPLYTVYKALSAIKAASCLTGRGVSAVPVFWAATEDHDFDEISKALIQIRKSDAVEIALEGSTADSGKPVGAINIPESFDGLIRGLLGTVPDSDLLTELARIWKPGRTIGEAFCTHIQQLFRKYGLIVIDPLDARFKKLVSPIYSRIAENASEIVTCIVDRSAELESAGFHAQVLVTPDYYPLFYHTDDGARRAIRRAEGKLHVASEKISFSDDQLREIAGSHPDRLSPGVMVRPIVQDYLFPTICYFGGGAEIAYFAQNSEAYRVLDRPVTPILHRQSISLVEPRHSRAMSRYELGFLDLFKGPDEIRREVVEQFINPTTTRLFADAEDKINIELNRLDQELSRIDPTLGASLATRKRKINYHIAALRQKFQRVQLERDVTANRRLTSLFQSLLPHGGLQERELNIVGYQMTYGTEIIDWIYDSIDLDERGHRLLFL